MKSCRVCKAEGDFPTWHARDMRHASGELFAYFRCEGCGCLQIEEVPKELFNYYKEEFPYKKVSKIERNDSIVKSVLRRAGATLCTSKSRRSDVVKSCTSAVYYEWFARVGVTKDSMILDVGCGTGELLLKVCDDGYYNASGIDPFIKNDVQYENGLSIKKGRLEAVAGEALFDLLMMHHSLEHIADQASVFAALARLVSPEGTVLLRIPVSNSYAWEEYGIDWVQLDCPRHLYLHTEESIEVLAKEAGLVVKAVEYDSRAFQFFGSELLQRGILIGKQNGFLENNGKETFGKKKMQEWRKKSEELNEKRRGDMAVFYLGKSGGFKSVAGTSEMGHG